MDYKKLSKFTLEKIQIGLSEYVGKQFLDDMKLNLYQDDFVDGIVVGLKSYIYGNEIKVEKIGYHEQPKTWWQHFKKQYFTEKLKARFPITTEQIPITYRFTHVCPHINTKFEQDNSHIEFLTYGKK